jgi:hypothetical protein
VTHNVLFDLRGCADSTCADALILMFVTLFLAASPQLRLPRLQGAEASGIPADPCKPTSPTQTAQPTHGLSLQAFRLSAYWSTSGVTLLLGTAHVFVFFNIVFCVCGWRPGIGPNGCPSFGPGVHQCFSRDGGPSFRRHRNSVTL